MTKTPFAPESIVAALNANDVAYVIVGGDGAIATIRSLADPRTTKLASGRPRDLVDVAELDDMHGVA